jgi:proline iminopeptidase
MHAEDVQIANGSFTAELDGRAIHYEVRGSGPVLMTVPNSWGLSLAGLRALYRPLERHATVVYFDPRGMGRSGPIREDADLSLAAVRADFHALQRHLGLERVDAVGWSNGAINLILLAAEHPDTLSGAVFVHGAASSAQEDEARFVQDYPDLVAAWEAFARDVEAPGNNAAAKEERLRRFLVDEYFPLCFADRRVGREAVPRCYGDASFSLRHWQHAMGETSTFDLSGRLAAITVPSLVVAGRHDLLPVERAAEMARAMPDARLVVFERSGHFAPLEEPELFTKTVAHFLAAAAEETSPPALSS